MKAITEKQVKIIFSLYMFGQPVPAAGYDRRSLSPLMHAKGLVLIYRRDNSYRSPWFVKLTRAGEAYAVALEHGAMRERRRARNA